MIEIIVLYVLETILFELFYFKNPHDRNRVKLFCKNIYLLKSYKQRYVNLQQNKKIRTEEFEYYSSEWWIKWRKMKIKKRVNFKVNSFFYFQLAGMEGFEPTT